MRPARPHREPTTTLSAAEARRLALAAQGFDRPRPPEVSAAHITATIRRLGLLQLDFVNVVCPSHAIIVYSRLGPYPADRLHHVVYRSGQFTEQWAHEASIIPVGTWPLLRDRMEIQRARPWGFDGIMRRHRAYAETVLSEIRTRGPLGPADLPDPPHTARQIPGSWYGNVPRAVLEAHFGRGRLAVVDRRPDFSRVFDLTERTLPTSAFNTRVDAHEAHRRLLAVAAGAHGVGTAADLADYFRMPVLQARPRLAELVDAGHLRVTAIDGWTEPAYMPASAVVPSEMAACALLSPFDPVVWFRPRARRLFGFDYRFEIFIPPAKRRWGAYVLPFLLGDRLVARVDVKAVRDRARLHVGGAWAEPDTDAGEVARRLSTELRTLSRWLGLEGLTFGARGNLMRQLRRAAGR